MTCGTCKWWDEGDDGACRSLIHWHPVLPASVTQHHNWVWPPPRYYMLATEGADCPCYAPRKEEK